MITKEALKKEYLENRKSTRECATIFGVSQPVVRYWMKKHEIQARPYTENKMPLKKGDKMPEYHKKAISIGAKNSPNTYMRGRSGELHHNYSQKKVACSWCGTMVKRKKSYDHKTFCNKECESSWRSEQARKLNPKIRITTNCLWCGKDLYLIKSVIDNAKYGNYCSRECHGRWRSEYLTGEKIYNFKGGYRGYYGEIWEKQRKFALDRDNHLCQRCGKTPEQEGKQLSVHHIIPFRIFGLSKYKEANDLSNLITLCNKCHKIVEAKNLKATA